MTEEETNEYFEKFCKHFPSFSSGLDWIADWVSDELAFLDEDVFCELVKYGNVLEMHVCDNVGDHLIGNVYARFDWEDEAAAAVEALNKRWYAGKSPFSLALSFSFQNAYSIKFFVFRSTTLCGVVTGDGFQRGVLSSKRFGTM